MSVLPPDSLTPVRPYITTDQLSRSPASLDIKHFLPDDNPDDDQLAAIARQIERASGMVNNYCQQALHASVEEQGRRVPVNRWGQLCIPCRRWPIREVVSVSAGQDPSSLAALDLTNAEVDLNRILIPGWNGVIRPPYARWRVIAGWPVTTLTVAASAGDTTLQVADATGIYPGDQLRLPDGPATERVTVTSVSGSTVTVPALTGAHAIGVGVTGLPDDIENAIVLMIDAGLRFCDSHQLTLIRADRTIGPEQDQRSSMLESARGLLNSYMRVV